MKILFVEDNESFASDVGSALRADKNVSDVIIVGDKDAAIDALSNQLIDLVILDLSIRPSHGVEAPSPEHGQEVFYAVGSLTPGTPVFILTGSEPDKFTRDLAAYGNQVELWGDRKTVETVRYTFKEDANELLDRISTMAASLATTNAIRINTRGKDLGLDHVQTRMLKSFARRADGVACDVVSLGGGLSDAVVFKATAKDAQGHAQALCAAKLGKNASIGPEREAFELHVKKLAPAAYAPVYCYMDAGVGQRGGIFYTLTDPDTSSLFEFVANNPAMGADVVRRVRTSLERWSDAAIMTFVPIADIRDDMIKGESLDAVKAEHDLSDYADIEATQVHISRSCIHGDLHCGNVLVKPSGEAILIDYGDAGPGFTCADPVTLELSLIFHPDAQKFGLHSDLTSALAAWPDTDVYSVGSPLRDMVVSCRDWAHDLGGSDLAVLGQAYAFGVRQLKYKTVGHDITRGFLDAVAAKIRASAT